MDKPLVVVTWKDAWINGDEPATEAEAVAQHKPKIIRTIGWLIRDDAEGVQVANEYYDEVFRGRTFVLRSMVVSVDRYKLSKERTRKPKPQVEPGRDSKVPDRAVE